MNLDDLTDRELRVSVRAWEAMAADQALSRAVRAVYADLAAAGRAELTVRFFVWHGFVAATGFPDWDTCVAALPDVGDVSGAA